MLRLVAVGARVQSYGTVGEGGGERAQGTGRLREGGGLGEEVGEAAAGRVQGLAVALDEPFGFVTAHQGSYGELLGVGGAGRAESRAGGDQRGEPGVRAEAFVDGVGIGVEVEQAPQPSDGGGQVAGVGQVQVGVEPAAGVGAGGGPERAGAFEDGDDSGAVREAEGTAVGAAGPVFR